MIVTLFTNVTRVQCHPSGISTRDPSRKVLLSISFSSPSKIYTESIFMVTFTVLDFVTYFFFFDFYTRLDLFSTTRSVVVPCTGARNRVFFFSQVGRREASVTGLRLINRCNSVVRMLSILLINKCICTIAHRAESNIIR